MKVHLGKWAAAASVLLLLAVVLLLNAVSDLETQADANARATASLQAQGEQNAEATKCVLYQFAVHRNDNVAAHREIEDLQTKSLPGTNPTLPPRQPVPEIPTDLAEACDPFLDTPLEGE